MIILSHRERAVFSTQAHVFEIDPETKKKWLPTSSSAVRVAFYHDPGRRTYRVISIENSKVRSCVNSIACPYSYSISHIYILLNEMGLNVVSIWIKHFSGHSTLSFCQCCIEQGWYIGVASATVVKPLCV